MKKKTFRRFFCFVATLCLVISLFPVGSLAEDPGNYDITISNSTELKAFLEDESPNDSQTVVLKADIDATGITATKATFNGRFNGNGKTIRNVSRVIFGIIKTDGVVENLTVSGNIADPNPTSLQIKNPNNNKSCIGIISAHNYGKIKKCINAVNVNFAENIKNTTDVGGICGYNYGTVENCINKGDIINCGATGGIATKNDEKGSILNCLNAGSVTVINNKRIDLGSIVGEGRNGVIIKNCVNISPYIGLASSNNNAPNLSRSGVLVGRIEGSKLSHSYSVALNNDNTIPSSIPTYGGKKISAPTGITSDAANCPNSIIDCDISSIKTSDQILDILNSEQESSPWKYENGKYVITISSSSPSYANELSFEKEEVELKVGEKAKYLPNADITNPSLTWSSSNENIVKVYASGEIEAIEKGEATITAKSGNISASYKVKTIGEKIYELRISDTVSVKSALEVLKTQLSSEGKTLKDVLALKVITEHGYELTNNCDNPNDTSIDLHNIWEAFIYTDANGRQNSLVYYDLSEAALKDNKITQAIATQSDNTPGCTINLRTVKLNKDITEISPGAFWNCRLLEEVEFAETPVNLKTIGDNAFKNCLKLTKLKNIGDCKKLEHIGHHAFAGGVSTAFSDRTSVKDLADILPKPENLKLSLTYVGNYAFQNSGITSLDVDKWFPEAATYGENIFELSAIKNLVLPAKDSHNLMSQIGSFAGTEISELNIPSSYTKLSGPEMFMNCKNLSTVKFNNAQIKEIARHYFADCPLITSIQFPDSVEKVGERVIGGTGISSFDFNNQLPKVNQVPDFMFDGCYKCKNITLRDGMILGKGAFAGTPVSKVTLPESVMELPDGSFSNCSNLTRENIIIKYNGPLKITGGGVFSNCSALTSIPDFIDWKDFSEKAKADILANDKGIVDTAFSTKYEGIFRGCTNLADTNLPEDLTVVGNRMFTSCDKLALKNLNGITSIGYGAFNYCKSLSIDRIPSSIESIGWGAFMNSSIGDNGTLIMTRKTAPSITGEWYRDLDGVPQKYEGLIFNNTGITTLKVLKDSLDNYKSSDWPSKTKQKSTGEYEEISVIPCEPKDPSFDLLERQEETIKKEIVEDIIDKYLTEEEREQYNLGEATLHVYLTKDTISKDLISPDIYKKLEALAEKDGAKIGIIYDINLFYELGAKTPVQITDLGNNKLLISIDIPKELQGKKNYYIYTEHEGFVSKIKATLSSDGTKITFETSKFSLYTLGYTEKTITPPPGAEDTNKNIPTTKPINEKVAKTFDENSALAISVLLLSSIAGATLTNTTVRKRKKK